MINLKTLFWNMTESNNYLEIYEEIMNFLYINNTNIQNLLINKKLDYENVQYYSDKKINYYMNIKMIQNLQNILYTC